MVIKYRSNLVCGIVAVLFAAVLFFIIPQQISLETTVNFGISSRTIPYGVATLIGVCGLLLIGKSLILKQDYTKEIVLAQEVPALAMFAVLIGYLFVFEKEWPLSTVAMGCASLALAKCKKWYYYLIVAAIAIGMYFLFVLVLHIRLRSVIFNL